jgi:hypothetical protein
MTTSAYEHDPAVYTHVAQTSAESPVAEALRTNESFTRDQVAWLMSQAFRWGSEHAMPIGYGQGYADGYQLCQQEWNTAAAEQVGTFSQKDTTEGLAHKWLREQSDLRARTPRDGDHLGGPVSWDDEPIPIKRGRPGLRVAA